MKICLSTETFADIPDEIAQEFDVKVIHTNVIMGEEVKIDGVDITAQDVFDYYDQTGNLTRTTAINEAQFTEYFTELLKDSDQVLHISFTSKSSATCEEAKKAAEKFDGKVVVVDSLTLSSAIALIVMKARDFINENSEATAIEIAERLENEVIPNTQASFVVNTLTYLYKGGRCSGLTMLFANVLHIKPQIIVDHGEMRSLNRYRGADPKIIEDYTRQLLEQFPDPDLERVYITYPSATREMVEAARKVLEERGFKRIIEGHAGATIATHCGPKTLGVLFINKEPVSWSKNKSN
ncbi:MAG: DegV family protein [Coprobacillus sp.]|nr:DegV family protein [Coprobacillus sp.]